MALIDQNMQKALWESAGQGVKASNDEAAAIQAAQLKQAADAEMRQRNAAALVQHLAGPKNVAARSFNPETGAIGDAPDNNLKNLMAMLALKDRREAQDEKRQDKQDTRVKQLSDNISKTNQAQIASPFEVLEKETGGLTGQNVDKSKLPGYWTYLAGKVPLVGPGIQSQMAKTYGGQDTLRALQGVMNVELKDRSGGAVTLPEENRYMIESGMSTGDPDQVLKGAQTVFNKFKASDENARAGFDSDVNSQYQSQGGLAPVQERIQRIAQERAKSLPSAGEAQPQAAQGGVPAGMKLLRNKVTGETKLVPR